MTVRDYTPNSSPAIQDSYFVYDQQDRVACENAATITGSCPLTGTNLKNNLEAGGFTKTIDLEVLP